MTKEQNDKQVKRIRDKIACFCIKERKSYTARNPLIDLSPLSGLLELKKLELPNNLISDVLPLAGLEQLSRLICASARI